MSAERAEMAPRPVHDLARAALLLVTLACWPAVGRVEPRPADALPVSIGGERFLLEIADDPEERRRGLAGRTSLAPEHGMLFVFPDDAIRVHTFLMRDCLIDLDVVFLDPTGRIVAKHNMPAEPPRGPGEGSPGEVVERYDARLTHYSSGRPAQFAIELPGGTLARLGVAVDDVVALPREALIRHAR